MAKNQNWEDDIQDAYDEMKNRSQEWQRKGGRVVRDPATEDDDLSDMNEEWMDFDDDD